MAKKYQQINESYDAFEPNSRPEIPTKTIFWFNSIAEAYRAEEQLLDQGIIQPGDMIYFKEMSGPCRGWGFINHEQAVMAKLSISELISFTEYRKN